MAGRVKCDTTFNYSLISRLHPSPCAAFHAVGRAEPDWAEPDRDTMNSLIDTFALPASTGELSP